MHDVLDDATPHLAARLTFARLMHIALGLILLAASVFKIWALTRYPALSSSSFVDSRAIGVAATLIEGFAGVGLWSGIACRRVQWFAVALFSVFAGVTAWKWWAGATSCGCFGRMEVRPVYTMTFDLLAVVGLLLARSTEGREERQNSKDRERNGIEYRELGSCFAGQEENSFGNPQSKIRNAMIARNRALIVGVCWLSTLAGFWLTRPTMADAAGQDFGKSGELVILEPEKWDSQRFALAEHVDVGQQLQTGKWVILLVHHDCDHCMAAVKQECGGKESAVEGMNEGERLAVIEMPPYSSADQPPLWTLPGNVLAGRLDESRDWFASTPVRLEITDGRVISATDGTSGEGRTVQTDRHNHRAIK